MKELLEDIQRWRARGERVCVATVVATRRSAPRPIGASFAVSEGGELAGSVSGGCVESDIYHEAQEVFASGRPKMLSHGIAGTKLLWLEDGTGDGLSPELTAAAEEVVRAGRNRLLELDQTRVFAEVYGPPPRLRSEERRVG